MVGTIDHITCGGPDVGGWDNGPEPVASHWAGRLCNRPSVLPRPMFGDQLRRKTTWLFLWHDGLSRAL